MVVGPPPSGREKQHAAQLRGCRRLPEANHSDTAGDLLDLQASHPALPLAAAEAAASTLELSQGGIILA